MADNNPPKRKYRSGPLQLAVWENQGKDREGKETTFETFSFERSYQDSNGEWQKTTALRLSDLPRLNAMLTAAYADSAVKTE